MEILSQVINYILNFGAAVFVPLIMLVVGLLVRMKLSDAIVSALTLGIAFTGMNVIINFMTGAITPAAQGLTEATGITLTTVDVGWPALSAIAWAWPYGVLCFPLMIVINIIMLATKTTNVLNVDLWNAWTKLLTAVMTYYITLSSGLFPEYVCIILGFVAASLQIIIELKLGDAWGPTIERLTGIPGVTVPHALTLTAAPLLPFEKLLEKIPALETSKLDAKWLRKKLGIFGENAVMGFIIGLVLGAIAYKDPQQALTLGIQAATAMQLFPMISKLFMQALSPLSDAVGDYMQKKFHGRQLLIGLDWPIVAGSNEMWVTTILLIPFELLLAVLLTPAGNTVLPFAGIINICIAPTVLLLAGGNLIKMLILGIIATPAYLLVSSSFAPFVTQLAQTFSPESLAGIGANASVTWSTLEAPVFRWSVANALAGNVAGIAILLAFLALVVWLVKEFKQRNQKLVAASEK